MKYSRPNPNPACCRRRFGWKYFRENLWKFKRGFLQRKVQAFWAIITGEILFLYATERGPLR
jgi:hypothetical protein